METPPNQKQEEIRYLERALAKTRETIARARTERALLTATTREEFEQIMENARRTVAENENTKQALEAEFPGLGEEVREGKTEELGKELTVEDKIRQEAREVLKAVEEKKEKTSEYFRRAEIALKNLDRGKSEAEASAKPSSEKIETATAAKELEEKVVEKKEAQKIDKEREEQNKTSAISAELQKANAQVTSLTERAARIEEETRSGEQQTAAEMEKHNQETAQIKKELGEAVGAVSRLEKAIRQEREEHEERLQEEQVRTATISANLETATREVTRLTDLAGQLKEEATSGKQKSAAEMEKQKEETERVRKELEEAVERVDKLQQDKKQREEKIARDKEESDRKFREEQARASAISAELQTANAQVANLTERVAQLGAKVGSEGQQSQAEIEKQKQEIADTKLQLNQAVDKVNRLEAEKNRAEETIERERGEYNRKLQEEQDRSSAIRANLERAEKTVKTLTEKIDKEREEEKTNLPLKPADAFELEEIDLGNSGFGSQMEENRESEEKGPPEKKPVDPGDPFAIPPKKERSFYKTAAQVAALATGIGVGAMSGYGAKKAGEYAGKLGYGQSEKEAKMMENVHEKSRKDFYQTEAKNIHDEAMKLQEKEAIDAKIGADIPNRPAPEEKTVPKSPDPDNEKRIAELREELERKLNETQQTFSNQLAKTQKTLEQTQAAYSNQVAQAAALSNKLAQAEIKKPPEEIRPAIPKKPGSRSIEEIREAFLKGEYITIEEENRLPVRNIDEIKAAKARGEKITGNEQRLVMRYLIGGGKP